MEQIIPKEKKSCSNAFLDLVCEIKKDKNNNVTNLIVHLVMTTRSGSLADATGAMPAPFVEWATRFMHEPLL